MTAPYSLDLRERALARKAAGETNRQVAAALQISPSCVSKWIRRRRETGSLAPAQIGGYKPRTLSGECAEWLRARVASGPFTLRGLAAELAERGIKTQARAVWVFVHAEGSASKKPLPPEEQTRSDVARRRARWKAHQGRIAPGRLVFIDETWVKTNMAPLRGWGPRGKRLKAHAPYGHWKTLTFIAALRHDRIDAHPGSSTGRSTANSSASTFRRCSPPRSHPATSWSWTTRAAIRARRPAPRSGPRAPT